MHGADAAIQAASQRGYEAVVMVVIVLAMLTFFGLLGRWFLRSTDKRLDEAMAREQSLSARIKTLETFVQDTLMEMVKNNATAMLSNADAIRRLTETLDKRLCILDPSRQDAAVDRLGDRLAERNADIERSRH